MRLKQRLPPFFKKNSTAKYLADIALGVVDRGQRAATLIHSLLHARSYDIVFVQWVLPPLWWVRTMKKLGVDIVFDFDDAVFLKNHARTEGIVQESAHVIAGSHFNKEFAEARNKNVTLIPTPVPLDSFEKIPQKESCDDIFTLGWIGGPFTLTYLSLLCEPFTTLAERYPNRIRFTIIGCMDDASKIPDFPGVDLNIIPRIPPEQVPEALSHFDVGVMPLFDRDFEKGKCALKALEYMASGIPAVCSAVGENKYVITDGENGLLAGDAEKWVSKISELIEDPEKRKKIGKAGKETVRARYSTKHCYGLLCSALGIS